jgi:hypothetical protein
MYIPSYLCYLSGSTVPKDVRRLNAIHRHCRLHSEWPRDRRAAKQRDELAASHSITSSASVSRLSEILRPSVFAVFKLITSSIGRLIDRQLRGLGALENHGGIGAALAVAIGDAHTIALCLSVYRRAPN